MSHRILVAQPSRTLQTLMRLTLASGELEVRFASEGPEALDAMLQGRWDLVVADAALGELDGYELVEAMRRTPRLARTPVLMTLADYETPDLERLAHLEVTDVLSKPFERHALLERVRTLLGIDDQEPNEAAAPDRSPQGRAVGEPSAGLATPGLSEARLAELVASEVARRLPDVVEASLVGALATIAQEQMAVAVDAAVARALPEVLEATAFGLGPQVEAALAGAAREATRARLEEVVWKVVPELAEELIGDEITRLTQD